MGYKDGQGLLLSKLRNHAFRVPSNPTEDELAEGKLPFEGWAVNVRCLQGVDLTEIPVVLIDGANLR